MLGLLLIGISAGCEVQEYRPVDLQLDLPGVVPAEAEQIRVCVEGVGERLLGARLDGRFSFTGLPPEGAVDVTVDVIDEDEAVLFQGYGGGLEGYAVGERVECGEDSGLERCEPCSASGELAGPEEDSRVLGVRFTG